ncbi:hypothetical protein D3C87_1701490 [compost metagenome]
MEAHANPVKAIGKDFATARGHDDGRLRAGIGRFRMIERAAIGHVQTLGLKPVQVKTFAIQGKRCPHVLRFERRFQATGRPGSIFAYWQVALGIELDGDDQELAVLTGLVCVQRVLGQLEASARLHVSHATLSMDAPGR